MNDSNVDKKAKGTKKCAKFRDWKTYLENNKIILTI